MTKKFTPYWKPKKKTGFKRRHKTKSPNESKYQNQTLWKKRSKKFLEDGGTIEYETQTGGKRLVKPCSMCGKAANTTDHILNPAIHQQVSFWDEKNWQPLCRSCHAKKSNRERAKNKKNIKKH